MQSNVLGKSYIYHSININVCRFLLFLSEVEGKHTSESVDQQKNVGQKFNDTLFAFRKIFEK